ncbi:MAG: hypothetical protein QNJ97_24435 [Myxococcota bacterium]|nr:hypothetical protein [Myxococcota bacterium]
MSEADILVALDPVIVAFEELGVRYHIGGSVASSTHGLARATLDVDLVADLKREDVAAFAKIMSRDYYIDEKMVADAVRRRACFNLIHLETMIKIDVFVLKTRAYDRQAFERMVGDTLEEGENARKFFLSSPEDTVLNKLEWFRLGDEVAERQWRDVLGVLKVQGKNLDYDYMRRWALDIGVLDLLERAIAECEGQF